MATTGISTIPMVFLEWPLGGPTMINKNNVYEQISSYENLCLAYKKARKHKTKKDYVIEFESNLKKNLLQLQKELKKETYNPEPLKTFILRS